MRNVSLKEFYRILRENFDELPHAETLEEAEAQYLMLDSIDSLRLLIIIDELSEAPLPDFDPPVLATVADAYEYYQRQRVAVISDRDPDVHS